MNPTNGDRSQVAIDASWGLGHLVVSGEVTPDNFLVDKVIQEIVSRTISHKGEELVLTADGEIDRVAVEPDRADAACISDDELRAVAALAHRAEKHFGAPQDVEWAIDRHLPEGYNVVLLQSRPETVWSQKAPTPIASHTDPIRSIVSTLLAPTHARARE